MHVKFIENSLIYKPSDIKIVLRNSVNESMLVSGNHGAQYYNVPAAFDIETTSFYDDNGESIDYDEYTKRAAESKERELYLNSRKTAIMYVWQFGINGRVIIGRTWEEFTTMIHEIENYLKLNDKKILIIYVHNLSYEFQFLCRRFQWDNVFSLDERKPIYARTVGGVEFRCSYKLSNYSLAKLGDNLQKYKVKKLTGDLDYKLLRSSVTPLTDKEIAYCVNDVRVVMAYIQELIEQYHGIGNLPLTSTGFVRRFVRQQCFKNKQYKYFIRGLTVSPLEFQELQRAFAGGFTHANAWYSCQTMNDVTSYDFTSSYPFVLCSELYPMSKGVKVKINNREQMESLLNHFCCLFDIKIYGLRARNVADNPLSLSKCFIAENAKSNNGRVVSADLIGTTITEIDFRTFQAFYKWDSFVVSNFYIYKRGFLPKPIIESVLTLYERKTTLKGVAGKEVEYLNGKAMLNSIYGMMVTNPLRDENIYLDGWTTEKPDINAGIDKYNNSKTRFLFYPWGVWVTAYARRNLFSGIFEFGRDYIYSDTDSVKVINAEKHSDYIKKYNETAAAKLRFMCKYYKIDETRTAPKTIKGVSKPLGVWDYDGHYTRFKTLGAKRYLTENDNGELSLTVAGLGKKTALNYLKREYKTNDAIFSNFIDGLYIPPTETGKNIHTYIDDERAGVIVDYKGNAAKYDELSAVHLQNCDYSLSLSSLYISYLLGVRNEV